MKKETQLAFLSYTASVLALNAALPDSAANFTIEPTVQQTLYDKMSESVDFLSKITKELVTEIKGEKLGLSASGLVLGRANVSGGGKRTPTDLSNLDKQGYECVETEFDVGIKWTKLDQWAKFQNFHERISNHLIKTYAQNMMMVGFNGISKLTPTNKTTNPLGQDVAKGWLQKIREEKPTHVLDEDAENSGVVRYGPTAPEYKNLDAVVKDAVNKLLPDWSQDAPLVAIVGRTLLDDKYYNLINENHAPTEQVAAQMILANKRLGGLPAYSVPFFPAGKILVTEFANLAIYEQEGSRRRTIRDNPDTKQYEDLQSSNIDFVVEDYDIAVLIENLEEVE